jgi:hypothetical protein
MHTMMMSVPMVAPSRLRVSESDLVEPHLDVVVAGVLLEPTAIEHNITASLRTGPFGLDI